MDKYSLKFLTRALRDMGSIYAYITETLQEPGTARNLIDLLEKEILSLEEMPNRCSERKSGVYAGKGYRQLFVKNYTVIYRVDESKKQVVVVTVRYSKSNF